MKFLWQETFCRLSCFHENLMLNNLHHRHNPWVHHMQSITGYRKFFTTKIICHRASSATAGADLQAIWKIKNQNTLLEQSSYNKLL